MEVLDEALGMGLEGGVKDHLALGQEIWRWLTPLEFSRTAQENGNAGTDPGHGETMMVLGGPSAATRSTAVGLAWLPSDYTKAAIVP